MWKFKMKWLKKQVKENNFRKKCKRNQKKCKTNTTKNLEKMNNIYKA